LIKENKVEQAKWTLDWKIQKYQIAGDEYDMKRCLSNEKADCLVHEKRFDTIVKLGNNQIYKNAREQAEHDLLRFRYKQTSMAMFLKFM